MSFHKIDNPAGGQCGFYAFAIGLLHLIAQEDAGSRPLYRRWTELDSEIQPRIDDFLRMLEATTEPDDLAQKKQTLIARINTIKGSGPISVMQNRSILISFQELELGFLLNDAARISLFRGGADVAQIVNSLQFDSGAKFVKAYEGIPRDMLDAFKNSIKKILLTKMTADLEELAMPGFEDDLRPHEFKLYQDFGELIDQPEYYLPHNFMLNSLFLRQQAVQIKQKLAGCSERLEADKKYVLVRQAFVQHKSAFLQQIHASFAADSGFWASDQDLIKLAEFVGCGVFVVRDSTPPESKHQPTIYLHNAGSFHWTTLIDSAAYGPIAARVEEKDSRSQLKLAQELKRYLDFRTQAARYHQLTAMMIAQHQGEANDAVIQELKRRRDCHSELLVLLTHPPQESSEAHKSYHAYCLRAYQALADGEEALSITEFDDAVKEIEQDVKKYKKEEYYPRLLQECPDKPESPPASPRGDMRGFFPYRFPLPPEPEPHNAQGRNYLIAAGIGIAVPALTLNAIPGVMPALLAATGMTVVSANLVFILLGVYLASMLTLLYNVYQESHSPSMDFNPFGWS